MDDNESSGCSRKKINRKDYILNEENMKRLGVDDDFANGIKEL